MNLPQIKKPYIGLGILVFLIFLLLTSFHTETISRESISTFIKTPAQNPFMKSSAGVDNSTLGFGKITYITVEKSRERQRGMECIAHNAGFKMDRHYAFSPIGPDFLIETPKQKAMSAMLSHVEVLREIRSSGVSTALILEDDIDFDLRIRPSLANIAKAVSNYSNPGSQYDIAHPWGTGWDIVWLGYCCGYPWDNIDIVSIPDPIVNAKQLDPTMYIGKTANGTVGNRLIFKAHDNICTLAYAVSYEGAGKILGHIQNQTHSNEPWDLRLNGFIRDGKITSIATHPPVFLTGKGYKSVIHEKPVGETVEKPKTDKRAEGEEKPAKPKPLPGPVFKESSLDHCRKTWDELEQI
ncbi:putative glycosyltransferase family 25 protein [Phaeomoniella chlamydospora]|uniref:Putative glycosyltransferase family 25 protein n=1 Tax=Phaeomoniella chlamydospora TaxID=158046 RepID=A0A0G2FXQ8_PHACM|nr:putative glycosyltransferase family 25 protein [Phaeomoniella chlamydospora]